MGGRLLLEIERAKISSDFELSNVKFEISNGETVAIVGPNGSGKSTLLALMAGFGKKFEGKILFDSVDVGKLLPHERPFSIKFQAAALFAEMTVLQNTLLPWRVKGIKKKDALSIAEDLLARLGLMGFSARLAGSLSGGEQQRVAIARTLLDDRPVLLLDEPFAGLDARARALTKAVIREWVVENNAICILVVHELESLFQLASRCIVLRQGEQVSDRAPEDIAETPQTVFEAQLAGFRNVIAIESSAVGRKIVRRFMPIGVPEGGWLVIPESAIRISSEGSIEAKVLGSLSRSTAHEVLLEVEGEVLIGTGDSKVNPPQPGEVVGLVLISERINWVPR